MRARADQLVRLGVNVEQQSDKADGANGISEKPVVKLRNVVGLLRGSDPALKDSYVIVSAHYDHIGVRPTGEGDRINNGANDDGSGTVSVIELASALASMKQRPKRSVVFIAWFGEEKGLQGSRYYARHPVFPLEKTVAMVNLEQLGRTDDSDGPRLNSATLTGFDFTDLGPIFRAAGEKTGVDVYKHEKNSDAFFSRSDNQALANAGIPAHTLCVAFIYPDYHNVGDHWEKIDYANLAKVNRMIALALLTVADNAEPPKWNESNPKTERYVDAWKTLHKKGATNEH
jgi:Zn-dependent M28 family amino/carboxypeptidase